MPRQVKPYRAKGGSVYHIYSDCAVGRNVARRSRVSGRGGMKLCKRCRQMRVRKPKR